MLALFRDSRFFRNFAVCKNPLKHQYFVRTITYSDDHIFQKRLNDNPCGGKQRLSLTGRHHPAFLAFRRSNPAESTQNQRHFRRPAKGDDNPMEHQRRGNGGQYGRRRTIRN